MPHDAPHRHCADIGVILSSSCSSCVDLAELSGRFPLSFPFSCGSCQFINVDTSEIHVDVVAADVVPVDFISMALL